MRRLPFQPRQPPHPTPSLRLTSTDRDRGTRTNPAHRAVPPIPPGQPKTKNPEPEDPQRVDHKVHGRSVRAIFSTAKPSLDQHKASLHEHDQKTSDQCPDEVDSEEVVNHPVVDVL